MWIADVPEQPTKTPGNVRFVVALIVLAVIGVTATLVLALRAAEAERRAEVAEDEVRRLREELAERRRLSREVDRQKRDFIREALTRPVPEGDRIATNHAIAKLDVHLLGYVLRENPWDIAMRHRYAKSLAECGNTDDAIIQWLIAVSMSGNPASNK